MGIIRPSGKGINQIIHILHNLNITSQDLLTLPKTACCAVQSHLLFDKAPVLRVLSSNISFVPNTGVSSVWAVSKIYASSNPRNPKLVSEGRENQKRKKERKKRKCNSQLSYLPIDSVANLYRRIRCCPISIASTFVSLGLHARTWQLIQGRHGTLRWRFGIWLLVMASRY
jgi:hypothetical protein